MARKSRKNIEVAVPQKPQQKVFHVGAYVRLSAVDKKQKGDSIENQQNIIRAYIDEQTDLELTEIYIDNGLSGQSFERPAFIRMLEDLENGRIDCCACKDLSRFGRNAIDTGYYIEKYFPTNGIRFIAINDDYDSINGNSGSTVVSLKNMVNEASALEIGRKIRTTKQMNIRNGCFVGCIPPYGFLKSREDNHKLVPDAYAAPIVRRMYEMAAYGDKVSDILAWLNSNDILPPKRYYHSIGIGTPKAENGHIHWNKGSIYTVLKNRVYVGDMVQGKGKTQSYEQKRLPESEWVITEGTHEGIVSRELFDKVQMLWGKSSKPVTRYSEPKTDNIFHRKVYCGHCGYTMRRARSSETQYNLKCETRVYYSKDDCVPVSINEDVLKAIVLALLQEQSVVFAEPRGSSANEPVSKDDTEIHNIQSEIDKNTRYLKGLYESLMEGDITNTEYKEMKQSYETKIADLTEKARDLRESARQQALDTTKRNNAAGRLQSLSRISDLTAEVVDKLIEKILVFEDKHIEVRYNFTDEIARGNLNNE